MLIFTFEFWFIFFLVIDIIRFVQRIKTTGDWINKIYNNSDFVHENNGQNESKAEEVYTKFSEYYYSCYNVFLNIPIIIAAGAMISTKIYSFYSKFNLEIVLESFYITFMYKLTDIFFTIPGAFTDNFETNYSFLPDKM